MKLQPKVIMTKDNAFFYDKCMQTFFPVNCSKLSLVHNAPQQEVS